MNDRNLLGPWIRRFLLEHMGAERNFSLNTQASYRDTLTLLLPFVAKIGGLAIDRMTSKISLQPSCAGFWTISRMIGIAAAPPATCG